MEGQGRFGGRERTKLSGTECGGPDASALSPSLCIARGVAPRKGEIKRHVDFLDGTKRQMGKLK